MGEIRNYVLLYLKGIDHFGDVSTDRRIILKWTMLK
jgi:hypothetical protein